MPGRDDRIDAPRLEELNSHDDRSATLPAERHRRRLVHLDDFGGVDDLQRRGATMAGQLPAHPRLRPHQHDVHAQLASGRHRTGDDRLRRMVAAHRVNGDAHARLRYSASAFLMTSRPA